MASKARSSFDKNAEDVQKLLDLHKKEGGDTPGRRYGLEVLNKSAIVLITAFWEAYCEDIAAEGLEHIVIHAKSSDAIPVELKKVLTKKIKSANNDLELWRIADDGWKQYLKDHLAELKEVRDRKLNTPKTQQIDDLFKSALGIEKMSGSWSWAKKMTSARATDKLDKFVSLRERLLIAGKTTLL